jgi:polyhydroxybutyrate depolymerase
VLSPAAMRAILPVILLSFACADPDPLDEIEGADFSELAATPAGPPPVNLPGTYRHRGVVGGLVRETIVYVPARAAGAQPVPVVFMLHGTSGDGRKFLEISGWREQADQEGFIAVFPTALVHCLYEDENDDGDFDDAGERHITTKWASGQIGDPARAPLCTAEELAALPPETRAKADHPLADDLAFFDAMIDALPRGYAVDTRRVYASGFSNGGQMTSRLAMERSERFAAVNASGGALAIDAVPAAQPMRFVFTVGERDDRFTVPLGVEAIPLDESAITTGWLAGMSYKYSVMLGLDTSYTFSAPVIAGRTIARFDNTLYTFGVIEGAGHIYPNGRNHPVVLANVLWEIFQTESLP